MGRGVGALDAEIEGYFFGGAAGALAFEPGLRDLPDAREAWGFFERAASCMRRWYRTAAFLVENVLR